MSTKIYNGLLLNGIHTLQDQHEFCLRARKAVKPAAGRDYKKLLLRSVTALALWLLKADAREKEYLLLDFPYLQEVIDDFERHGFVPQDGRPGFALQPNYLFREVDLAARRAIIQYMGEVRETQSQLNFDLSVGIYPIGDKVLGLPFCGPAAQEAQEAFFALPEISQYPYWDCTDPDESVSPEEWEQRKLDWDKALPGIGIPRECGVTLKLLDGQDIACNFYDMTDIPADNIIRNTLLNRLMENARDRKIEKWGKEHPGEEISVGDILRLSDTAKAQVLEDTSLLERAIAGIKPLLGSRPSINI